MYIERERERARDRERCTLMNSISCTNTDYKHNDS